MSSRKTHTDKRGKRSKRNDLITDPAEKSLLAAKALALNGDLPGCQCYRQLSNSYRNTAPPCEHVLNRAVALLMATCDELEANAKPKDTADYIPSLTPQESTTALPSTPEKIAILRERISRCEAVDKIGDVRLKRAEITPIDEPIEEDDDDGY